MKGHKLTIGQTLIRLAPEVTTKDLSACSKKLKISKVTICYYLQGKVGDADKGLELVAFFKNCIEQRQSEIQQLCK